MRIRTHAPALVLALVAGAITIAPHLLLWSDSGYRGIEIMMLDAENHYFARVQEVYEGYPAIGNTFLPDKEKPYATPPLGEITIAIFGKIFGLDAPRAAVLSKPLSVFIITLLIYVFAWLLSRSRIAALVAAAVPVFGYNLIKFSLVPFTDLLQGSPAGGPFFFFSRLVNPSVSGILLFGALALMFHAIFERERATWWQAALLGTLIGASLYISPFAYSFLGALLFIVWIWALLKSEYARARGAFFAGLVALFFSIPFAFNYISLHALPEYEHVAQHIGVVVRRDFILGLLLPLLAVVVAFGWTRFFSKTGRTFLLLVCTALFCALNQQLLTGVYLQPGHYHWYITKPLAGIILGMFVGGFIHRFLSVSFARVTVVLVLVGLVFNSMGFVAPWYAETRADILSTQMYAPVVTYLNTLTTVHTVWSDETTSDYIPIYTRHYAPNSINVGAYPVPQHFFDNRVFLEYRLRGVKPEDFEDTIRREAGRVSGRLWGMWLNELVGDASAIPQPEYERLVEGYSEFYKKEWNDAFKTLNISLVVVNISERDRYSSIQSLEEVGFVGEFILYQRL